MGLIEGVWNSVISVAVPHTKHRMALEKCEVRAEADGYAAIFDEKDKVKRAEHAQELTVKFYNLITDIYEYGWGQSFHFGTRYQGESFDSSIARHEHYLAAKLGLKPGDEVLDVGCGVMGPAREIARFSGATVTGLNINQYQVERCEKLNSLTPIADRLKIMKGDFMKIPCDDNSFDKIYACEALVHAPDQLKVYQQIYSKLKPGGLVALYEWCLTDKYDDSNPGHRKIREMIEYGNSICSLRTTESVDKDIVKAGFEPLELVDLAKVARENGNDIPWYFTLEPRLTLDGFKHSSIGRALTTTMVTVMEKIGLAPAGTIKATQVLNTAADGLVQGGQIGIFTPMYLVLARKPVHEY